MTPPLVQEDPHDMGPEKPKSRVILAVRLHLRSRWTGWKPTRS
jgi:hypothetical protein